MPAIVTALPQPPPPPAAAADDEEPAADRRCPYTYVRLEDVSARYFQKGRRFQDGQLVWVCKSKGRKKGKKSRSLSGTQDSAAAAAAPSQRYLVQPQQRGTNSLSGDDTAGAAGVLKCPTENGSSKAKNNFNQCPNRRLELFLRARVVQPSHESNVQGDDRVLVRYPRGSTYRVRRDHLILVLERQSRIVVVVNETPPYRKCCAIHTLPHETFLEIGCDLGHNVQRVHETRGEGEVAGLCSASSTLSKERALVVGVDKSPFSVARARESYPHLAFALWDALEHPTSALHEGLGLSQEEFRPDVIAVDINGSRELPAVLACLSSLWAIHRWEPRLVIVKSRTLHAHLQERPAVGT